MRVQSIRLEGEEPTWTVLGADLLPAREIESYLEFLRQTGASPNTVKAYARGLALWWEFLELRGRSWDVFGVEDFTGFLGWMRSGLPPGVESLASVPARIAEATAAQRLQAVRSFYVFQQWHGIEGIPPLFLGRKSSSSYLPFLTHIRRGSRAASVSVKVHRRRRAAPTLTPAQIDSIKQACAHWDPRTRSWSGSIRDRLFFALLEETGLRLGEALSLQHRDWHSGGGENPYIEVVPRPHPHGARVKGGNYRKLYISDELDRLYAEYVWHLCEAGLDLVVEDIDASYVFVNVAGGERFAPIRPETIYKLITRIKRVLGDNVPARWSPHWFRHTHATALLLSGRPIHVVSRRLGHADVQTTLNTYAWVTEDEELRALADWAAVTKQWRDGHADI
ncbi:tyrosine-type recombinase/integrase [Arthrobacter sp. SD76]|uniref:tyrosine-type recombinase/integrase n=1 Tax=Arthrobacter sp. SD76 TaxID=3415007 RepID=UPI003C731803